MIVNISIIEIYNTLTGTINKMEDDNFDIGDSVTYSPTESLNFQTLSLRQDCLTKIDEYYKYKSLGKNNRRTISELKGNIMSFFHSLRAAMNNTNKDVVEQVRSLLDNDIKDCITAFELIDDFCYDKEITKIDIKNKVGASKRGRAIYDK